MADDYAYQQTRLRPKPEGPFGFGSKAAIGFGSRTSQGSGDGGPGGGMGMMFFGSSTTGGGFNFNGGYSDGGGSPGGTNGGSAGGGGGGGSLPNGTAGSLLRHNGTTWVTIGPSLTKGILTNNAESHEWISGVVEGDMIYYDGNKWTILRPPRDVQAPLVVIDNQIEWLRANALGTYVLGIENGIIRWLETESCDL